MHRSFRAIFPALVFCFGLAGGEPSDLSIELAASQASAVLGTPMVFKVKYNNNRSVPWNLNKPDLSMGLLVYCEVQNQPNTKQGFFLNSRILSTTKGPNGEILEAKVEPPQPKIEIAAGKSHLFEFDFFEYWPDWRAGIIEVWIEDEGEKLVSNKATILVSVEKESVPAMLQRVEKEPEPLKEIGTTTPAAFRALWRYQTAGKWLQSFSPRFHLEPIAAEDDAPAQARKAASNAGAIRAFRVFWERQKESSEVKETIARLNTAGAE